jgi:hypothetical protein
MLHGTRAKRSVILSVIVPADGTSAATCMKRRLRYVADFWAALGQTAACLWLTMWGVGRKAQWQIEELSVEHLGNP